MLLTEQQLSEKGISVLQKVSKIIKEYNIEAKYQEIQELYPQVGFFLGQQLSGFLTKQT